MKEKLLILVFFLSIFSVTCETDEFSLALTQISNYLRKILREKSIPIAQRLNFALVIYRKTIEILHEMEQALLKKQAEDKVKEENFKKLAKIIYFKKYKSSVFLRF
jgi:uncharacterized protein YhhL (DUF1145 family)